MDNYERYLRDRLAELQRRYLLDAEPYLNRLAAIESYKPLPPIYVTLERAKELGIPITAPTTPDQSQPD